MITSLVIPMLSPCCLYQFGCSMSPDLISTFVTKFRNSNVSWQTHVAFQQTPECVFHQAESPMLHSRRQQLKQFGICQTVTAYKSYNAKQVNCNTILFKVQWIAVPYLGVKSPKPRLVIVTPIIQTTSLYSMHVPWLRSSAKTEK